MTTLSVAYRLPVREYAPRLDACQAAAAGTGLPLEEVKALLTAAGQRVRSTLRLGRAPLVVGTDGSVSVEGVAGVLTVAPGFELEIVPKFLDPKDARWREDFFAIATLSAFGHVLPRDAVAASASLEQSLPALLARAMINMYWQNHRRPLRTYERRDLQDFALHSEVDPLELALPDADGFLQRRLVLARDNELNAVVAAAVAALLPRVRDAATQRGLQGVSHALGPQPRPPRFVRQVRLPPRHKRWQPLHDLSVQILRGFGGRYDAANLTAPGFVMDTWRAWQDLVGLGARLGLPGYTVATQAEFQLGTRDGKVLPVVPDIVATGPALRVADAKYIGRSDKETRLGNTEVYEALAFMLATQANKIALFYPGQPDELPEVGQSKTFSIASVSNREIHAIALGVRGLSAGDGLLRFSEAVGAAMLTL